MRRLTGIAAIALTASACGGEPGEGTPARAPEAGDRAVIEAPALALEVHRGHVAFGPETRSFRPCGSERTLGVQDRTGLLRDLHEQLRPHAAPEEEIFVSLLAAAMPSAAAAPQGRYDGELAVAEVEYAAAEGHGCESDWGFRYRAAGNEPFGSVTVSGDTLRLSEPGAADRVWPGVVERAAAEGQALRLSTPADTALTLELVKRACRDSMSGAWSPLAATLRVGERVLEGCAFRGDAAAGR